MGLNAFMVPETRIKFTPKVISIEQPSKSPEHPHEPTPCVICNKNDGLIYNCSMTIPKEFESQSTIECTGNTKCGVRFHPLCAYFVDLLANLGWSLVRVQALQRDLAGQSSVDLLSRLFQRRLCRLDLMQDRDAKKQAYFRRVLMNYKGYAFKTFEQFEMAIARENLTTFFS